MLHPFVFPAIRCAGATIATTAWRRYLHLVMGKSKRSNRSSTKGKPLKGKASDQKKRRKAKTRETGRKQTKNKSARKARRAKASKRDTKNNAPALCATSTDKALITVDARSTQKSARVSDTLLPASAAVISEWGRRVEAEYRSAAITQHLTLWLIQMAASPDVIHAGLRIVTDELLHAQLSHETFVAAGGVQPAPIARESLSLRRHQNEPLEAAVARHGVETFCLGETVAVPLFKILRRDCVVPTARKALDRILKDEIRHRDFGWTLLQHLLTLPCAPLVRQVVDKQLPTMFARIRRSYAPIGGEKRTTITKAERGWGLMPIATYGEILTRTVKKQYRPRFAALGFNIDEAWQRACQSHPQVGS